MHFKSLCVRSQVFSLLGDGLHIKLISSGISFPRDIAIDHNSG